MATRLGSDFDKLTVAVGISNLGDGVMGAAFPLLVASLTRDPVLVSGATLAGRLPWFLFALVVYGFLIIAWNVVSVSLRQGLTPDEMRGRVAGAARLLAWGSQPLGALAGGWVAATLGLRAPFFVAAAAFAVMLISTWTVISNQSIEAARSDSPVM